MSQSAATKPAPSEHAPEFSNYVNLVREGDIIQTLEQQIEDSLSVLRTIPSDKGNFRYAPDKWSIKELLGHRLGKNLQLSRLMFCTKRPNSAARI